MLTLRRASWLVMIAGLCVSASAEPPRQDPADRDQVAPPTRVITGQDPRRSIEIPPAEAVKRLLAQSFLTDEERKDLRIQHGVWEESDLDTPARRARAMLASGRWDDASLADPAADALDRAEAAILRGELDAALSLLDAAPKESSPLRASRLRGQALEALGLAAEAGAALEPIRAAAENVDQLDAPSAVEVARGLLIRARVLPQESPEGGDFKRINTLLARVREQRGKLYPPAYIAEAELMYEKNTLPAAQEAVAQGLSLHPRSAAGWYILGRMSVDSFSLDRTERFAAKLDDLGGGASPLASMLRARAALRQSDAEGALEALTPAMARHGNMRALLAVHAAATALTWDFEQTDRLLAEFDARSPGSAEAYIEVGRALAEARQYTQADRYLIVAAQRAPFRAEPLAERGLMLIQAGRDGEAREVLKRAIELDPFNTRADNSRVLVEELATYERVETPHFVIRHKPGSDGILAREMAPLLESMHERVTGSGPGGIDHVPAVRTTIDLMPNQRWFAVRIAGVTQIHTMAASTGPCIAMEVPRVGPGHSVGTYDWLRVLRHEYVHTVTLSRTNNRIPHWFTEAAAVYLEDAPRDYSTIKLLTDALENDGLFDLQQINIAFVRPKKPTDRSLAYAQGHWMYEYIVRRWGERAPLDLMDRYAKGEREERAFAAVLGKTGPEFLSEFRAWAREQVTSWGMSTRPGHPSVREILLAEGVGTDEARESLRARVRDRATGGSAAPGAADEDSKFATMTREIAERWLAWYPDHAGLLETLIRMRLKDTGQQPTIELLPLLEQYAAVRPVDPMPHQMLTRWHLAQTAEGSAEAAIPHLEFLDVREQSSPVYAMELARQYAAQRRWDQAIAKAQRGTIVSPFDGSIREEAARIALLAKRPDVAMTQLRVLAELEPDRPRHQERIKAVQRMIDAQNTQ